MFTFVKLKKGVENNGSLSLDAINLTRQNTLRPEFVGAFGIQSDSQSG